MKYKIILLILSLFILSACSTNTEIETSNVEESEVVNIPELQEEETTDHMSVVGNTNEFLSIVGTNKNVSIRAEEVEYYNGVKGYLVRPDDENTYPGVVMIHEWWGLNEHIKEVANTMAREGYVVLAVDLYNGEVAETSEQAMQYRLAANQNESTLNMKSAVDYLKETEGISKVASMGFCFGGEQSAKLSTSDANLDATIIFYGSLPQEIDEIRNVDAPVLGIFGELDTGITPDTVRVFESGLNEIGYENDITIYEGVGHAFANPGGSRFAENETKDAWMKTLSFLETNLN
jgi:carboxymethylenebutenolidase